MGERKNKAMRAATTLMAGVLLSTSVLSGTMAKYVSSATSNHGARVAKYGVVITNNGELFGSSYALATASSGANQPQTWGINAESVSADTSGTSVVAPGTKSPDSGLTFKIAGTAEVSTKLTVTNYGMYHGKKNTSTDIFLSAGKYGYFVKLTDEQANDYLKLGKQMYAMTADGLSIEPFTGTSLVSGTTYYGTTGTTTLGYEYHPLKFTVTGSASATDATMAEAMDAIVTSATLAANATKKPNETYNLTYNIKYEWPFESNTDASTVAQFNGGNIVEPEDKADTILGRMIADPTFSSGYVIAVQDTTDTDVYNILKTATVVADQADTNPYAGGKPTILYAGTSTAPTYLANNGVLADNVVGCLSANWWQAYFVQQVD